MELNEKKSNLKLDKVGISFTREAEISAYNDTDEIIDDIFNIDVLEDNSSDGSIIEYKKRLLK